MTNLRITTLGTGGGVPTAERNLSGVMVQRGGDRLLFDCGEGIQREMIRYGVGFDLTAIFITHADADHYLGLPGLLRTLDQQGRDDTLRVFCPDTQYRDVQDALRLGGYPDGFYVDLQGITAGHTQRYDDYAVRAFSTAHRGMSLGYAVVEDTRRGKFDREKAENLGVTPDQFDTLANGDPVETDDGRTIEADTVLGDPRPGRHIVYTGDTGPSDNVRDHADDADVLIHESTFTSDNEARARRTDHSTAEDAGKVAADAGADKLVLTHISPRAIFDGDQLVREAEQYHDDVVLAEDGTTIEVPYPEKDTATAAHTPEPTA